MYFLIILALIGQVLAQNDTKIIDLNGGLDAQWQEYKAKYNKNYQDPMEDIQRKANFVNNLRMISEINSGFGDGYLGVNQFSDYSAEEKNSMRGLQMDGIDSKIISTGEPKYNISSQYMLTRQGGSSDWKGACAPVKNQGRCGSCWAFASAAALECNWRLYGKGDTMSLSDQQLLDCTSPGDNNRNSCSGGSLHEALENLHNRRETLVRQNDYPYTGRKGQCQRRSGAGAKIEGGVYMGRGENQLGEWVEKYGAIVVGFMAHDALFNFKGSGVWDGPCGNGGHAVTLVGSTSDSWILKNSWGDDWGDRGYFKMRRGRNLCRIGDQFVLGQP